MKIIFFGSSEFALPSLKALLADEHEVSCVVTQPDRQKGRGLQLAGTAVKALAQEEGVKVYQPLNVNTVVAANYLKTFKPDLFVVISYGQILSKNLLGIPKKFAINAHASLLPKYRGAAPINWAIINGEKNTGITIIKMEDKMDAGPVMLQKVLEISDWDNAVSLTDKLSQLAAQALLEILESIKKNTFTLRQQNNEEVTLALKLEKNDGLIDWSQTARKIYNLIRGVLGWPGAYTYLQGRLLKIYKAEPVSASGICGQHLCGQIIEATEAGITVATAEGCLVIKELQIEGKRKMQGQEFMLGHKALIGQVLGKK